MTIMDLSPSFRLDCGLRKTQHLGYHSWPCPPEHQQWARFFWNQNWIELRHQAYNCPQEGRSF